ncbi:MAG TPA: hypothetical protein VH113_06125 [Gemmatimonadales bacterium]|nr:hypothetical protein [Gemmatimonadales bacterium]
MKTRPLSTSYACRYGVPILSAVDPTIFTRQYFTHCLECTFCHDACCVYGVDYDWRVRENLKAHAVALETLTGIPQHRWFAGAGTADESMPGGGSIRTATEDGACIFLNRESRGCRIHAYALSTGVDYHDLKSIVDCLFPLTWEGQDLVLSEEVLDSSLICLDTGPTVYRGVREELRFYFGDLLVAELDGLEATLRGGKSSL